MRDFMRLFSFCLFCSVCFVLLCYDATTNPQQSDDLVPSPVNVLFVAIDDLRPELGCYGSSTAITPNFDAFAQEAFVFERAVCAVPVCGASRASVMTGLRPNEDRFRTFSSRADEDAPEAPTMAEWLKAHGYTAVSNGKILHKNMDSKDGWSEKPWRPDRIFRDYQNPENTRIVALGGHGPATERGGESAVYADDLILEKSISDLERLSLGKDPFFLGVGFFKPHLPFCAPERFWDLHDPDSIGYATNRYAPKHAPKEAMHSYGELRAYDDIPSESHLDVPDSMQLILRHGYHACVSYVDHLFGQLIQKLEESGLADNTLVVVWGDHGWQLGEHNLWAKHANFQTSLKVPLLIRLPGQEKGLRVSSMVELTDLYPTICALLGIERPPHVQGVDLGIAVDGQSTAQKRPGFSKFHGGETITTEAFSYTEFRNKTRTRVTGTMLFNLAEDPNENLNISDFSDAASIKAKLSSRLDSLRKVAFE